LTNSWPRLPKTISLSGWAPSLGSPPTTVSATTGSVTGVRQMRPASPT